MNFEQSLAVGKVGESLIARWLLSRGASILPVYEKQTGDYKGPTYITNSRNIIAPDMLVFGKQIMWVEAKHKTAFTWHRITQRWVTGIDRHHFSEYQQVEAESACPVWLLFLHQPGVAKDTPDGMDSPTGLYGNSIAKLALCINHVHDGWGKGGMVYWAVESLIKLAPIENIK